MAQPVPLAFRIAANLSEFRANLAEMKSQLETTKKSMQAMANSLDGSKIIADGNAMVKAVTDIGGAAKLTEAEQRRVNVTATEALAKYKALGQEAPAGLQKLADETRKLEPPLTMADRAAGLLKSSFGQFTAAGLASTAISTVTSKVGEFVATGLKLPAVQDSFGRLTASLKQDGAAMLANMTTATKGMVSNYDLMQTSNKAMLLGLPVTAASMGDLAKTATVLGKAMGQDATKSLDDLITALGRSSPMILDNLGLTVKVGEANEAYAAKLGKTSEQLTEAEKKQAFYEAAMEAARKKTKELGEQTRTLGEILTSVWTQAGNIVSGVTAQIDTGLGRALSSMREFGTFMKEATTQGIGMAIMNANLRAELSKPAPPGKDTYLETAEHAMARLRKEAQELSSSALVPLTKDQGELAALFDKGGKSAQFIAEKLHVSEQAVAAFLGKQKDAVKAGEEHAKAIANIAATLVPLTDAQKLSVLIMEREGQSVSDTAQALGVGEGAINKYLAAVKASDKAAEEWIKTQEAMAKVMTVTPLTSLPGAKVEDPTAAILKNVAIQQKALDDAAAANAKRTLTEYELQRVEIERWAVNEKAKVDQNAANWQGAFAAIELAARQKFEAAAAASSIASMQMAVDAAKAKNAFVEFFDDIPQLIQSAFTGGGGLGGALDAMVSKVGSGLIGKLFSSNAMGPLVDGVGKLFGNKIGMALAGAMPGIGQALGALAGPLIDKIVGMFQRAGRDAAKAFAAEHGGFDQLRQDMLVLGDEGERLWKKLTQQTNQKDANAMKRVIDEITAALEAQKTKQAEVAAAAAESAKAQQDAIDEITAKYQESIDKLDSEYKSLAQSVAAEAEEAEMGVVETQQRLRMAQIEEEKKAKEIQRDAEIAAKQEGFDAMLEAGKTVDEQLRRIFAEPHNFAIRWTYPDGIPAGGSAIPMAGGGDFITTKPTVFVSSEHYRPERVTFSGEGRTEHPGRSTTGTRVLQPVAIQVSGRTLIETMLDVQHAEGLV